MDHNWKMNWRFLVPQALTGLRIVLSAGSIAMAMAHESTIASKLIVVAVVTDILDGPVAARLGVQSDFGALFDYFADYLCYVVAPMVLTCTLFPFSDIGYLGLLLVMPLLTGAIRYARNAILLRTQSFADRGFPGLLTVCYALFVTGAVLTDLEDPLGAKYFKILLCTTIPIFSLLMISRIRYPKLTVSKVIGILVVLFLLCVPFVETKLLAGFMLCAVFGYTFVSPFLMRRPSISRRRGFL